LSRNRDRALETQFMWIAQYKVARTFIWLAVLAIPLQGLPVAACGCANSPFKAQPSNRSCCSSDRDARNAPTTRRCCQRRVNPGAANPECCSAARNGSRELARFCSADRVGGTGESGSCCHGVLSSSAHEIDCTCSNDCQCDQHNSPAHPATSPIENSSFKRILVDYSTGTNGGCAAVATAKTQLQLGWRVSDGVSTALDRCITLCRFII